MRHYEDWSLADLPKADGPTVFSCFHCGGGSTMGYKLAGMRVLGGVDIDKKMVELYRRNFKPKFSFADGIIEFNKIAAESGVACDILDGSPPCSSFSMAGARDDGWGTKKKFREGQEAQRLDDLFFDFIETASILKPRVVVSENVKGIITGVAKGYAKEIVRRFADIGYTCRIFLLCASRFGVPQRRQRVFFIAARTPDADRFFAGLEFKETSGEINFSDIDEGFDVERYPTFKSMVDAIRWSTLAGKRRCTEYFMGKFGENKAWGHKLVPSDMPAPTITAAGSFNHWGAIGQLTDTELRKAQSFPRDYDFNGNRPQYVLGMSVPPLMMQRVAEGVRRAMESLDSKPAPKPRRSKQVA